jgi:hypothetical protein
MLIAERAYFYAKKDYLPSLFDFETREALFSRQACQISQYTSHSAIVSVHVYKAVLLS